MIYSVYKGKRLQGTDSYNNLNKKLDPQENGSCHASVFLLAEYL